MQKPLAEQMRPHILEDVVGQEHLLGQDGALTRLLANDYLPSIIFWGPPGVGKTTLAYILAQKFGYRFVELSGVEFSVRSLEAIKPLKSASNKEGQGSLFSGNEVDNRVDKTVVFVDEIHRLNKSQQAQFLPYVERGQWILIGATTENPSFEVISPLLSRSQVLVLKGLSSDNLRTILVRGMAKLHNSSDKRLGLSNEAEQYLLRIGNGDARMTLNALQAAFEIFAGKGEVTAEQIEAAMGNLHLIYDKHGDEHFDTISALHKSMRGSDPNASVYYLGRMLEAGEDPLYVARRCVRFASEDIGNAEPMALVLANTAFEAVSKIGMPEANVILAQLVIFLSRAPKSNEAYTAYGRVQHDISKYGNLPIPLKIRNAPTKLMDELGYGDGYKYAHDYSPEDLEDEQYLPDKLAGRDYLSKQQKQQDSNDTSPSGQV